MMIKKKSKFNLKQAIFGFFFAIMGLLSLNALVPSINVYAESDDNTSVQSTEQTNNNQVNNSESNKASEDNCKKELGELGWWVCPSTGKIAQATDWLYEKIEDILVISPVSMEDGTPIYEVWKYCRGLTNIVFIIFLLVVIYSQVTGLGLSNYGIKKVLPKLIIAAVLVNMSFLVCSFAVDISNVVGSGLRGFLATIAESAMNGKLELSDEARFSLYQMYTDIKDGLVLGGVLGLVGGVDSGMIWMLIPIILGGVVAVASGLITIALRQAVVALLIMISPLAMVAYMLPNIDGWFKKWKDLLFKMLVFYPMFGASNLAGFAIISSANDGLGVLLGMAIQIFPLFFSWSLMKMSGTFLGTINTKIRGLAAKPLAANRAWAESRRQLTRERSLERGVTPFSHLYKYMDKRKALREHEIGSLQEIRKHKANIYVQRKIGAGYDGTKAQDTKEDNLRPNRYTKIAKDLSNLKLESETVTMDTTHAVSNYKDYFVNKNIREKADKAMRARDTATLDAIARQDAEFRRHAVGGKNYLEYSRAQMTAENDGEADFNFMVGEYLHASMNYDPSRPEAENKEAFAKYRHYILSSAGGLGAAGQTRVLGKIIAKAASVENSQRRDINIIANKFPPDKRSFRNFLFNYYVDDDGFATDKNGNRLEEERDYLRVNDPSKLVAWSADKKEIVNGVETPYYDWYDSNGKYVTRIYKSDKSAIKELMSNFDAPINDPINNLLAIHAGIKEQPNSDIEVLKHLGLDAYRTTIGRALLSAPFKEKNAAFSPMVAEMVKNGYIQNYAQEYIAYLDSFNKATKPGAFNTQDGDAIDMFIAMMDPDQWERIFPTELIRGYRNVNGNRLKPYKLDENGDKIRVDVDEATREELMTCIIDKFIVPAAHKITVMMSRQTPNTIDAQKPGTIEKWKKLKETLDNKWGDDEGRLDNPYKQNGDMRLITREIQQKLKRYSDNRGGGDNSSRRGTPRVNHHAAVSELYDYALDADSFAVAFGGYCESYPELQWVSRQFQDFVIDSGYGVTKEQLYDEAISLLDYASYDD